jgi:hypothetical protein
VFVAVVGVLHVGFYGRHLILDTTTYRTYGSAVVHGEIPYRDFDVEYPPGALPVFVAPALLYDRPAEFVQYNRLFQVMMVLCGIGALLAMRTVARSHSPLLVAALAPLLLGSVVLYRFDLWPTALAVAALAALASGRERWAFALLALATAAKIWPIVLLPLFPWSRRGLAVFGLVLGAVLVPFWLVAGDGLWDSVRGQLTRPLQVESLGGSALVALGADVRSVHSHGSDNLVGRGVGPVQAVTTLLQITAVVAVWIAARRGGDLARWSAAAVCAFVAFGKVLSPQFLVWLIPLVALAGRRSALALFAAALVLTQVEFPFRYERLAFGLDRGVAGIVLARDLLLVALLVALVLPDRGWSATRSRLFG